MSRFPKGGAGWRRPAPPSLALVAGILVALLALIPFFFIVAESIQTDWATMSRLLFRPRMGELASNTVRLIAASLPLCAIIGVGAAWLTQRTMLPGRRVWNFLLVAPLAVPAFVNSFGWVTWFGEKVEGYGGAVVIVTLSYFPLVYLPVAAALRGLDQALEESARALGHGPGRTFLRVTLPQLRPALFGGLLLVALHLLAEFGALELLRFPTFTVAIFESYQSTFNGPAATSLAGVLVLSCLLLLLLEVLLRGRVRYARIGAGVTRQVTPVRLGLATPFALLALAALLGLALGVPLVSLGRWLVISRTTAFPLGELASVTMRSIGLGLLGALVTTALALPVVWVAVRRGGWLAFLVERSTYLGHTLPGIVVALALVTFGIRYARPIYQTTALLLIAYAILFMPLAVVSIRAALVQVPPSLDEAARALGARPLAVFWRVTLPLLARGLGAGGTLVFLAVITELTATLLLAPTGTVTLASRFWSRTNDIAYGAAAPYALLMIVLSAPTTLLLTRDARRAQ
ncbi:MAG: iron ABC transporter permease [Thermomicrobiales bacterium]